MLGSVSESNNSVKVLRISSDCVKHSFFQLKWRSLREVLKQTEKVEDFRQELEELADEQFDQLLEVGGHQQRSVLVTENIEVNEKPPINWWNVAALAGMAVVQVHFTAGKAS